MYETYYQLKAKPFQLSPDPRFFYNSRGHKRALAYLRYGVKQGEGFIIITGDVGTGKTMLVQTLLRALERENVVAAQIVTSQLQADDLLRLVAAAFGLAYQRVSKATVLRSLEIFFRACVQEGKRVLLVVDEAQALSRRAIEELRMLSNFQMNGRSLLQSFLLGQREFRTTMRSEGFEQLRQRVIAAYHLKPLEGEEIGGYIEHRLRLAGWQGVPAFDPRVFDGIHEFTQGVPRRINTLCDRLMLYGALEELRTIDTKALRAVAEDIIEEQGGGEVPEPVLRAPGPATAIPGEAAGSAALVVPPVPGAGNGASGDASRPGGPYDPVEEARLHAVESSVAALAEAMREELALLRKAVLESRNGSGRERE